MTKRWLYGKPQEQAELHGSQQDRRKLVEIEDDQVDHGQVKQQHQVAQKDPGFLFSQKQ